MKEIREDLNIHILVLSTLGNQVVDLADFSLKVGQNTLRIEALKFPAVEE